MGHRRSFMKDAHVRGKEIITTDIKYLVVEGEAIDIIRFPITRMYAGHDLNDAVIHCYFEFEDGSGGFDLLTKELSPGGELVYAYWQVKGNATSKSGKLQIQLKARKDSTVIWRTKRATIIVEASLSPDELGEFTPTILDQYLALYQGLVDDAEAARDKAENWAEEAEDVEVEEGMYSAKHHSAKAAAAQTASEAARDKAENWAEEAEDVEVEEGMYSAKHHSAKAAAAQSAAEGARDGAEGLYGDLAAVEAAKQAAQAARDKAENWAEEAEDVEVEEGMYSAKHHSAKAAAAQSAAEGARDGAEGLYGDLAAVEAAKLAAQTARDKAESWSEADEDVEVEEGMYSAKHHSAKAAASAAGADESEYQALLAKQAAQAAQGLAEGAKDDAEIARDNAEALYGDLAAVEAAKLAAQEAQGFAEEAKDDAEAARDQAALYAAELDDSLMPTHLAAVMPHQIVDQDNLVTYRYGFKIQNGDLVFLSEEVV
jgi:hypothetical protein